MLNEVQPISFPIEYDSSKKFADSLYWETEIEVVERSIENLDAMPTTYVKDNTSRIMDMIERLEAIIGVRR